MHFFFGYDNMVKSSFSILPVRSLYLIQSDRDIDVLATIGLVVCSD